MRKLVVPPHSAWFDGWRVLTRGMSPLVVVGAFACMPMRDLSDYAAVEAENTGNTPSPTEPNDTPSPDPVPPRGTDTSGEGVQDPNVPLAPNTAVSPPASTQTNEPDTATSDAGAPIEENDASPPPPDAAIEPPPIPVSPACALDETTGPNGHCYVVIAGLLSWDAARANCQVRGPGWDLTSIRSEVDTAFVLALRTDEVWVGGSDAVTEETWTWVNDGLSFWQGEGEAGQALNGAYVNWFADEPNGSSTSDCVRLLFDATWADTECANLKASICEGPKR